MAIAKPHFTCVNTRNLLLCAVLPLLLLAACTHDDAPASPAGIPLPPDTYPLQIASVTISADGQPRTRLADEGNTTKWQDNDEIMVSLGDKQSVYTYSGGEWHSDNPLCWESTAPQEVNAWYPVADEIDFTQQNTKGLTYLLKAETVTATYNQSTPINLNFTHQLAKVRVLLDGEKAEDVEKVYVRSHPKSANNQGSLGDSQGEDVYVPMYKTTYEEQDCWEATLRDGTLQADNSFQVAKAEGKPVQVVLDESMRIAAGQVYTINISVNPVVPEDATDITQVTGDISGNGDYVVRNTYNKTINITGDSPTIYLDGATVSVANGNAINITNNATPTIYVVGEGNTISSSNSAGIYVAENATVTITSSNRSDVLTVTGYDGSSGIGGYVIDDSSFQSANSGNINIKNVTLYAYSSSFSDMGTVSPGIGSTGSATCQSITIDNAAVYAYGCGSSSMSAPAIGNGIDWIENTASATPTVTISNNSEVHAHRGESGGRSFADYIGRAGVLASPYSDVKASVDATSVVYKYTGYGNTPDQ